jgi:transcription antitermination factor NusG
MLQRSFITKLSHINYSSHWYAIYTRHQHERTVAQILTSKGFETLLPLYQSTRRWKDRTKLLSLPLFPCYVFLNGGLERRLDILTTPGIHSLVSTAGSPTPIPTQEIEAFRRTIESGFSLEPHPFLRCGDVVRVKCGPLAGTEGILVRKKNVYRLVLSIEMLGQAAAVEVDALLVERVGTERDALGGKNTGDHQPQRASRFDMANRMTFTRTNVTPYRGCQCS